MERFLTNIYKTNCEPGDYIILSSMKNGRWKDTPIQYHPNSINKRIKQFIDNHDPKEYDLYFSPHPYETPHRRIDSSIETKYLAQDIDENDDIENLKIKPSYVWESSPNKYQGLWELDRYITEEQYTPLNAALCDYIGADEGCFDFTHVYRIPGTINHKYKNEPPVSKPTASKLIYRPKKLEKVVGVKKQKEVEINENDSTDLIERKIYAKYNIPKKVRDLLALDNLDGIDRSNTIWYIENKLVELGMKPNEIIHLVKNSVFNKYKDRKDQDKRLKRELEKIISGKIKDDEPGDGIDLELSTYQDVMSNQGSFSGWMVKGFWGRASHGMVAGMPKTMKSTIVQDFAVSVASGEPFLGKYEVIESGPVIIVQNENADYIMRDRNEKMINSKGLVGDADLDGDTLSVEFPPDLPIYFINQQGFTMTNEEHRRSLEKIIEKINPVLVIFDPLYLMFEGELNSGADIIPALNWLLSIKKTYDTSVMVIHHYKKGGKDSPKGGERMSGSVFLYGWIESAWYLQRDNIEEEVVSANQSTDEYTMEPTVVNMDREFRFAGSYPSLDLYMNMGEIGNPFYEVDVQISGHSQSQPNVRNLQTIVIEAMDGEDRLSIGEIASKANLSRKNVRECINELVEKKKVGVKSGKYYIYK